MKKTRIEDLPEELEAITLGIELNLTEREYVGEHGEELRLVYVVDIKTLPVFDEPATYLQAEVRLQTPEVMEDPSWLRATKENIGHAVKGDLAEALGLFLGHVRGRLEVRPKLDDAQAARFVELATEPGRMTEDVRVVPMRANFIVRAVAWLHARGLAITLFIAAGFVIAWLLFGGH